MCTRWCKMIQNDPKSAASLERIEHGANSADIWHRSLLSVGSENMFALSDGLPVNNCSVSLLLMRKHTITQSLVLDLQQRPAIPLSCPHNSQLTTQFAARISRTVEHFLDWKQPAVFQAPSADFSILSHMQKLPQTNMCAMIRDTERHFLPLYR